VSYHVTILRTKGKQSIPITAEEVLALAAAFPQWEYDAGQNALVSRESSETDPALWFSDGELWTKNPSEDTLSTMLEFAAHIGARVRGDELETYRTPTESYLHPDDAEAKSASEAHTGMLIGRTRLKSIALRAAVVGAFALIALLFVKLGFLK
jgi:hypothetical protein